MDVEKSIAFYEKLGLRLIVKHLPHYARFECTEGSNTALKQLVLQNYSSALYIPQHHFSTCHEKSQQ